MLKRYLPIFKLIVLLGLSFWIQKTLKYGIEKKKAEFVFTMKKT